MFISPYLDGLLLPLPVSSRRRVLDGTGPCAQSLLLAHLSVVCAPAYLGRAARCLSAFSGVMRKMSCFLRTRALAEVRAARVLRGQQTRPSLRKSVRIYTVPAFAAPRFTWLIPVS